VIYLEIAIQGKEEFIRLNIERKRASEEKTLRVNIAIKDSN
jgi:hypothetical protein